MQDEVYNRALFKRKSDAARQKLRDMGGVPKQPSGILASSPDLMMAAMPAPPAMKPRPTNGVMSSMAPQMAPLPQGPAPQPLPQIVPGIFPQPQQPQQPQPKPMAAPQPMPAPKPTIPAPQQNQKPAVKMAQGGDVTAEAYIRNDPRLAGRVDVTKTPVPMPKKGETLNPEEILKELRQKTKGNEAATKEVDRLESKLRDPNISEREAADVVAGAVTGEQTPEGRAKALESMTGESVPNPAQNVDRINRAIMAVSVGGAIGGPGSVAERVSNAILTGLKAERDTAVKREDQATAERLARMRAAAGGAKKQGPASWLDTPQGKQAADLYEKMRTTRNMSHEATIEEMNKIAPGLGNTYQAAMGGGMMAQPTVPGAAQPAAPSTTGLTNLQQNAQGVVIGWNGQQWVNAQTGQPYTQ